MKRARDGVSREEPETSTLAWGLALGGAAVIGTLAALATFQRLASRPPLARSVAAFVASFVFYQLTLYVVAASWLGGTEMFAPGIVSQVLVINALTRRPLDWRRRPARLRATAAPETGARRRS